MPLYVLRCEGEQHEQKAPFEWETYLPRFDSPNPPCEVCGGASERVWRGRQHHGELSGWPMTTKMLDGVPRTFQNLGEWKAAVKAKGLVIRDDASWQDEELGEPAYDWKTGRTVYPNKTSGRGCKGQWV